MTYLRTPEEIKQFCKTNGIETISISAISTFIEEKQDLSFLGYFQSMLDDSFWTYAKRGGHQTQDNKFGAEPKVLDFILNSKIYFDSSTEATQGDSDILSQVMRGLSGNIVKLFGKMENGKIIELLAFNTGSYDMNPYRERTGLITSDLWF